MLKLKIKPNNEFLEASWLVSSLCLTVIFIGLGGAIGHLFNVPWLGSYLLGAAPKMPLFTAFALILLGLSMLYIMAKPFSERNDTRALFLKSLFLGVLTFVALCFLGTSLAQANFNIFALLIEGAQTSFIPFLSLVNLTLCCIALFIFWKCKQHEMAITFGVGLPALVILNLNLFALIGYWRSIPALYYTDLSLPTSLAYIFTSLSLLIGTIPYQGIWAPLLSKYSTPRLMAVISIGLGLIVLMNGIADITRFDQVIIGVNSDAFKKELGYAYRIFELSNIALSVLVTTLTLLAARFSSEQALAKEAKELTRQQLQLQMNASLAMTSSMAEGVYMTDKEGYLTFINAAAEEMLGWSKEEFLGKNGSDLIHFKKPDGSPIPPEECLLVEALRSGVVFKGHEDILTRKDGTQFPILYSASPLMANQIIIGAVLTFHDITDRKQVEQALLEMNARKTAVMESSLDAVLAINHDGKVLEWNEAAKRILGYSHVEAIGMDLSRLLSQEPTKHNHQEGIFHYLLTGEGAVFGKQLELSALRKNGTEFPAEISIMRTSIQGDPLFIATLRDITQRKQVEDKIQSLNDELEQRVVERTEQLMAVNKELESFSYTVSHDLRAPLRGMDGYSQALIEDYGDQFDAAGKGYLHQIRQNSQRMGQLITDLLNLSRLGRQQLEYQTLNLSVLANELTQRLIEQYPEREVQLEIAEDIEVKADPGLIEIVLQNLFENAWKFTNKKPIAKISLGQQLLDDEVVYFIKDNGAGFDMAFVDKLFGPFQRLHGTNEYPGTGIGLATVARIIHRHGGKIWAEGKEGEGATFYFTLDNGKTIK